MPEEVSLSIEETNKLRISLGLKPLKVNAEDFASENSTTKDADDNGFEAQERRAVENWKKYQEEQNKKEQRERQKEEIKKAKDAINKFRALEGKGLGEADDVDEDAATWLRKMKKRQKKLAQKMAEELAARDEAAQKAQYTATDVSGLSVAHDMGEIEEGGEMVLTLKDATIDELEEEGDELENIHLNEKTRLHEKLELKKKRKPYDIYEDSLDEHGKKSILAQYDDEIDPKRKKKSFVLQTDTARKTEEDRQQELAEKLRVKHIALELPEREITSDYIDPSQIKIKKVKRKNRACRKKNGEDDDTLAGPSSSLDPSAMDLDDTPASSARPVKRQSEDVSFVDDEELQSSLALQRRQALKKRKILKPEDLARQLREESATETPGTEGMNGGWDDGEEPGILLDETTEFVASLRAPIIDDRRRRRSTSKPAVATTTEDSPDADDDVDMDRVVLIEEEEDEDALHERFKREPTTPAPLDITSTGLGEEVTLNRGIGSTLAMLRERSLLKTNDNTHKLIELERERERFKSEKRLRQMEAEKRAREQRDRDRKSGIFDKMSAKEREEYARWENKQRDQQEAKEMAAKFKDYRPNVQLSYKDEFGREMSKKEAFKYLSHQFHGKGSGKAKTEKRLKKIEEEKRKLAASTLQPSAEGLTSSMADKAKKNKQAGVRLM